MRNIRDWSLEGNCATTREPDAHFPERGHSPLPGLRMCRGCPVTRDCLEYALVHDESGVWGGTTQRQRTLNYNPVVIDILREQYNKNKLLERRTSQPILYILRAGEVVNDDLPALNNVLEA